MLKKIFIVFIVIFIIAVWGLAVYFNIDQIPHGRDALIKIESLFDHSKIQTEDLTSYDYSSFTDFTGKNGDFSFKYPKNWSTLDTTPTDGNGEFGPINESWIISSFDLSSNQESIPDNSIKIDFDIQTSSSNISLNQVVSCEDKTVKCEYVEINGQNFRKSTAVLNDGITNITLGSVKDKTVFKVSALIQQGDKQEENISLFNQITQTFKFQ